MALWNFLPLTSGQLAPLDAPRRCAARTTDSAKYRAQHRRLSFESCETREVPSALGLTDSTALELLNHNAQPNLTSIALSSSSQPDGNVILIPSSGALSTSGPSVGAGLSPLVSTSAIGDQNEAFVRALYRDVLQRAADPDGINGWLNAISAGATRLQVAAGFWESAEHRGLQIDQYYLTFLNRAADAAGRQGYINAFQSGLTESDIIASFVDSGEAHAQRLNTRGWVQFLYTSLLNRSPSIVELVPWVGQIDNGGLTTRQVAEAFVNSSEYHARVVNTAFTTLLGRTADAAGLSAWVSALDNNQQTITSMNESILSSVEYFNRNAPF